MGVPRFGSILLTWSPPQQPNGIITSYSVTYQANGIPSTNTVAGSVTMFTISSLTPASVVVGISVRASTSAGLGDAVTIPALTSLTEHRKFCTQN